MINLGFTYYDTKPVVQKLTTVELLASLSGNQKLAVLDGFAKRILPKTVGYNENINRYVVLYLYRTIDAVEERAKVLMRGEVIIDPGDPNAEPPIFPTYNIPPETAGELATVVQDDFSEDFTPVQVNAILAKMVQCSKYDCSGDWDFYKTEVIK